MVPPITPPNPNSLAADTPESLDEPIGLDSARFRRSNGVRPLNGPITHVYGLPIGGDVA